MSIPKWCVNSGANRDICKEVGLAQGRQVEKKLNIGEVGSGHSFTSEAEGPISVSAQGKELPLLARTIFAQINSPKYFLCRRSG